jgi:alpha-beta hydrolase superfamily lysophospholipase
MSDLPTPAPHAAALPAARDSAGAQPIVFRAAGSWCFGWHHPAVGAARGVGVVLCRPFGYESVCAHRTYTLLAQGLAQEGFDVLRFDYQGTGDSAGGDTDPARVAAWLASIEAAVGELRRASGVSRIALAGVRLGAMLAARAASALGGVESLVLWAPCGGRAFGRELRAAAAARGTAPGADGDIEALGYRYTAQTLQGLAALDREPYDVPPAERVLVIARDDMPADDSWAQTFRSMGVATSSVAWHGYAAMMVEPHEAVIAHDTIASIRQWLAAAPEPARARQWPALAAPRDPVACIADGARETPLVFGGERGLFGILAEPACPAAAGARAETAVLLLSVGANHHIGPNRNYVRLARALAAAGYRAFRIDMKGIGDARGGADFTSENLYSRPSCIADVGAAIDCLAERGCKRFYLMGICSGSYAAFQATLAEPRVSGQILMNSRLLDWDRSQGSGSWEESMHSYYKSSDYYLRALLNPRVYWRALRGQVDARGIGKRFLTLGGARLKRLRDRLLRRGPAETPVLAHFRRLGACGTDTLVVMAEEDDGRDYIEFHVGSRGARLRGDPNFRLVLVPHADHTFSSWRSQQLIQDLVLEHLNQRTSQSQGPSAVFLNGATMLGAG